MQSESNASSARSVLISINPNGRKIFKVLAESQLTEGGEKGLSYKQLYDKCRELFLVNNEMTMKSQMTEFRDHKVISTSKNSEGLHLFIPIHSGLLKQIVEEIDQMD
jgi:origin recognition complex subunit 2